MSEFLGNGIVQGVLATLVVAGLAWIWTRIRDRRDEARIVRFLEEPPEGKAYAFRTTQAISSGLSLTAARVEKLCSRSRRVRRNAKERESWTLADRGGGE